MSTTTDMNIILGQGNALKEVHNARRQSLDLNQQFIAQHTEEKKKTEKVRVQDAEGESPIRDKNEEQRERRKALRARKKAEQDEKKRKAVPPTEGSLIDITV